MKPQEKNCVKSLRTIYNAEKKLRLQQTDFEDTLESPMFQQSFMEPEEASHPNVISSNRSNNSSKLKYKNKIIQSHDHREVKTCKMPVNPSNIRYSFKNGDYDRQFKPRIRK